MNIDRGCFNIHEILVDEYELFFKHSKLIKSIGQKYEVMNRL